VRSLAHDAASFSTLKLSDPAIIEPAPTRGFIIQLA
jgi:hypothetical protein